MTTKALVSLSGGLDSTLALIWAQQEFDEVRAITFNYGHKTWEAERLASQTICRQLGIRQDIISVPNELLRSTSPLVNSANEVKRYEDASEIPDGGKDLTFVPGRNILFSILLANRAYALDCPNLVFGISEQGLGGYPDARRDFADAMAEALTKGMDYHFQVLTPLMQWGKQGVVEFAQSLPRGMELLAFTTTCYEGGKSPCTKCRSCLLRAKGFADAGLSDPLLERLNHFDVC